MGAVAAVPVARALGGGEGSEEQRKHRALRASPWMGLCMNWLRRMEDAGCQILRHGTHLRERETLRTRTGTPAARPRQTGPLR
jgi:hypothetical protein